MRPDGVQKIDTALEIVWPTPKQTVIGLAKALPEAILLERKHGVRGARRVKTTTHPPAIQKRRECFLVDANRKYRNARHSA